MVRDLMLDMEERDLLFTGKYDPLLPMLDSFWGNLLEGDDECSDLICNIVIPESSLSATQHTDTETLVCFKSQYVPNTSNFRIRLVKLSEGKYSLYDSSFGNTGVLAHSYVQNRNVATPIAASVLPLIDIDGEYLAKLVTNSKSVSLNKAYVYSAKNTDIKVDFSDNQASQLLSVCIPGCYHRYPMLGVGIVKYLNCVIGHSDLIDVLQSQFESDDRQIQEAEFDNETGKLDVIFTPEQEQTDDYIDDISDLNADFFRLFDDGYTRRNIILTSIGEQQYKELLYNDEMVNLVLFIDESTSFYRPIGDVQDGRFDADGNITESSDYCIVSLTVDTDTIIMFDNEGFDTIDNSPVFIVNGIDETRLYTSLVAQPYWIEDNCHKCCAIGQKSAIQYMISKEAYKAGKGLYIVPSVSANIKNMVGVVQDSTTGKLTGIVSESTNIDDVKLDEITQGIYTSQIS